MYRSKPSIDLCVVVRAHTHTPDAATSKVIVLDDGMAGDWTLISLYRLGSACVALRHDIVAVHSKLVWETYVT